MAKPKNNGRRSEIYYRAAKLFREHGYNNTSYQMISDAVGESRALIQYYIPKKTDFVTTFFEALGTCTAEVLQQHNRLTDDSYIDLYLTGQVYFTYLAKNEPTKKFVVDVLEDRSLSDSVLLMNSNWVQDFLNAESEEARANNLRTTLIRGGGLLTYIHYCITNNLQAEVLSVVKENTQDRMIREGVPTDIVFSLLEPYLLSEETLDLLVKDLDDRLFKNLVEYQTLG